MNEETCSTIRRRRGHSPETRAKMSASRKGVPHSPEHCQAIRVGSLRREQRKREQRALLNTNANIS